MRGAIAEDLTKRKARLSLGGSVYDPTDPVGRLLFNVLAMVAEFEADLIPSRTREGMRVAKAKGHLRGKQPKLNPRQKAHVVELLRSGEYTTAQLGDLFGVARSTVYRAVERSKRPAAAARPIWQPANSPRQAPPDRDDVAGAGEQPGHDSTKVFRPRHGAPACCRLKRSDGQSDASGQRTSIGSMSNRHLRGPARNSRLRAR
jgi:Resolvase, N terminal domain/Helix-turn-helix domain of resolvase